MSNSAMLRERADRCREIAKEYHPEVGRPLLEKAAELERRASALERNGIDRRRSDGGFIAAPARAVFGRRDG